ncbi:predicted protein [Chaetomium globosum CBS 148.51]|uniref:Uncharacterized protein n=1 Tax=Chaetomium globosum (strain ATCC 6205 / CBS 148.51 / DSM 1962 / NBRC 6347 / NRRL 1970) TaxID=306901 RepID=Q2H638_CHAGB|nr:uncharacterized protein CHGG_05877 [Chaetomium globosum CBS 148.51]EAQ89258.1 predicted protein [Chaetomium globosum CBS 148.51]
MAGFQSSVEKSRAEQGTKYGIHKSVRFRRGRIPQQAPTPGQAINCGIHEPDCLQDGRMYRSSRIPIPQESRRQSGCCYRPRIFHSWSVFHGVPVPARHSEC